MNAALQETKAQLSHYRYSIVLQDEIRKERHELKNKYFYIQTLVHEKKFEQLEDYLNHESVRNSPLSKRSRLEIP